MIAKSIRHRLNDSQNIWPGFVDVLATLLIVIIFVLMIFTVSQIYLSDAITGRDRALENLKNQINELTKILIIESKEKQQALKDLSTKESELKSEQQLTEKLESQVVEDQATISTQSLNLSILSGQIEDLLSELKVVAKALETYEGADISSLNTKGLGERINKALALRIDQLNELNEKLLISQEQTETQLKKVQELNQNLSISQEQTETQLKKVQELNQNLMAINESLGLEDADLVDQLAAIQNKNQNLAITNEKLNISNSQLEISQKKILNQLKIVEDLNLQLSLNEEKLQDQISQYQMLTEELIALNDSLDLKDKTLTEQLDLIKAKNNELAILNENLIKKDATIFDLRDKILALNNILSLSDQKKNFQQSEINSLNERIIELENEKQKIIESSTSETLEAKLKATTTLEQVTYLSNEIEVLKDEINILNSALEASEQNLLTKELKIEVLGEKLNKALTSKVFELQKYRSEFFGRLQTLLGERKDIRVVGDRFIFESELLFDSGSATLQSEGRQQLKQIGLTLMETTNNIPNDIDWIIQVEGHTDKNPINTLQYPSNWELSSARANTVLKLLLELGFEPQRLSAAGYGEFYPISEGESLIDFQQNRRIELKLTSR